MSTQILPVNTTGEARYTERVVLDGREYILLLDWNQREEKWYLSISDEDGAPIVGGIKVVADYPLLRLLTDSRRPPGMLIARDTTGAGLDPHFLDLGARVQLAYFPIDDVEALAEDA